MRRIILLGALAALAVAAVAATANAQTVTKFSVVEKVVSAHRSGGKLVTHGKLVEPGTRNDVEGFDVVKFGSGGRVHGVAFFPDGKLKVQGNLSHHKVPIIGGTRRWNGAAGKLKFHGLSPRRTLLTFTVVQ